MMFGKFVIRIPLLLLFTWIGVYLPGCDSGPPGQRIAEAEHEKITLEFVDASENDGVFKLANRSGAQVSFEGAAATTEPTFPLHYAVQCRYANSEEWSVPRPALAHGISSEDVRLATGETLLLSIDVRYAREHKGQPCRLHLTLKSAAVVVSQPFTVK
jgi:hypothetical protein